MALSIAGQRSQEISIRPGPSPKRKRNDSISHSASDSIFAPDLQLSSLQTTHLSESPSPSPPDSPHLRPSHHAGSSYSSTPVLQIPLLEQETHDSSNAESPRSAVARKLEGLDLALQKHVHMPVLNFGDSPSKGGDKKKVRLDPATETLLSPAQVREGSPSKAPKRVKSPVTLSDDGEISINWWTDDEITGHLGEDPEDDGYGINGIGFKPTPAMAQARSARRRKQIEEWRTREMREERRRRAEGRRARGGADPGGGSVLHGGVSKRSVRFAGS